MLLGLVAGRGRHFYGVFSFLGENMIDFKTYDEQIEILKARGLIIDNETTAKNILKKNNYYNVVNAYKDVFLQKGRTPETFIKGVNFNELIAVHQFDKHLRLVFSHYLIIVERAIKSIIAYEFSKNHPNHDQDYLNIINYNNSIKVLDDNKIEVLAASELIRGLNKEMYQAIDHGDEMVCHYKTKYNRVPLWVFINKLTFGTLSKMYNLFNDADRDAVAKSIGELSNQKLFYNEIKNAIKILVYLRNKTAHDQRVYDFNSETTKVSKKNAFLQKYNLENVNTLFGAVACFSLFLSQRNFDSLLKEIKQIINELFRSVHSIPNQIFLNKMGFPQSFLTK